MFSLEKAKVGVYHSIQGYEKSAPKKMIRRLLELGLTKGQKVRIVRKSLFGKAYLIEVRGYVLSIRKALASFVLIDDKRGDV